MPKRKTSFDDITSLVELQRRLRDEAWALRLLEWLRWPAGRICPFCEHTESYALRGRRAGIYECRECGKQFTATNRTPLHGTKLPISTWLTAVFLIVTSSKGVSSVVLANQLGVSQRTAWKIGHAVRLMMRPSEDEAPLIGVVEVDDLADGGDPARAKRAKYGADVAKHIYNPRGRGSDKKRILTAVERGGRARAKPMTDGGQATVEPLLREMVGAEARVMSDGDKTLGAVGKDFASHKTVNHSAGEYARGDVHVNTVEAFNLFIRRAKEGVWHRWSETHQQRYLEEIQFHWDNRPIFRSEGKHRHRVTEATSPIERMRQVFAVVKGRQLRWTTRGSVEEPSAEAAEAPQADQPDVVEG